MYFRRVLHATSLLRSKMSRVHMSFLFMQILVTVRSVRSESLFVVVPEVNTIPVQGTVTHVSTVTGTVECATLCSIMDQCDGVYYNQDYKQCVTAYNQIDDRTTHAGLSGVYLRYKDMRTCRTAGYQYAWELGICLKFIHQKKDRLTWIEARDNCESESGNLIAVDSEFKDVIFTKYLLETYESVGILRWYIGATDIEVEGTFKWTNGNDMTYTNWKPDQPDNADSGKLETTEADCVQYFYSSVLGAFQWFDISCNFTLSFVCENREFV